MIAMASGVTVNSTLREVMRFACETVGCTLTCPKLGLCTDNAAMIGFAAYYEYYAGRKSGWDPNAILNLKLGGY